MNLVLDQCWATVCDADPTLIQHQIHGLVVGGGPAETVTQLGKGQVFSIGSDLAIFSSPLCLQ